VRRFGDQGRFSPLAKTADATQLFGNLTHHRLRQSAEWPKQPSAINRAGLIDHHHADASVADHPCRHLDAQEVFSAESDCTRKDPRARMVRLIQQVRLEHDDRRRTFPGSPPRRGFRSADQMRRGNRSGIFEALTDQRIELLHRPEGRGSAGEAKRIPPVV